MIIARLLDILFPPKCILCQKILEKNETDLCEACRIESSECRNDRKKRTFLDSWLSVWYYEGYIRRSLIRFKFYRKRHYACAYGRLLAMRILEAHPDGFDILTWVPVSRIRKIKRGYDQDEVLAVEVGKELGIEPVATLRKIRNNRPQSRIQNEAGRRANVLGVYRCAAPELVAGKRILILDDIITTGATAGECARVLKTAGAKEVHCGTVAATRHFNHNRR